MRILSPSQEVAVPERLQPALSHRGRCGPRSCPEAINILLPSVAEKLLRALQRVQAPVLEPAVYGVNVYPIEGGHWEGPSPGTHRRVLLV